MADGTAIEWTHRPGTRGASWNPVRAINRATGRKGWHCEHASDGCRFCYAEGFNRRLGTGLPFKPGHRADIDVVLDERIMLEPLRWKAPRTIFVCSMTDAFGDFVTDAMLDRMFAVAALCPQHVFIWLTKRAKRMREYLTPARATGVGMEALELTLQAHARDSRSAVCAGVKLTGDIPHLKVWPLPNVWLGVSAEDQATADERVPDLLATPAAVRFVSAEPQLGQIDFCQLQEGLPANAWLTWLDGLDWIIVGGESGPHARPMHPEWARSIRDQCAAAQVPFFFKQWGAWEPVEPAWREPSEGPDARFLSMQFERFDARGNWIGGREFDPRSAWRIRRVGKSRAGRLLDGVEHNAFPEVRA